MRWYTPCLWLLVMSVLMGGGHALVISEIHPDVNGSDAGREWLEVYNDGSFQTEVNLSGWRFHEDDTDHLLALVKGDWLLEAQERAIIVDDPGQFMQAFSDYQGTVIDSAWGSLRNDGEHLAMKNANDTIVDVVNYSAAEEGKSLCRETTSSFTVCNATPGFSTDASQSTFASLQQRDSEPTQGALRDTQQHREEPGASNTADNGTENSEDEHAHGEASETHKVLNTTADDSSDQQQQEPSEQPSGTHRKEAVSPRDAPVSVMPTGTGHFDGFVGIDLTARNIESIIVHIEDARERKLSKGIRFFIDQGTLDTRFFVYTPAHCGHTFQRPFYVAAYYGGNVKRTPVPFAEQNCSSTNASQNSMNSSRSVNRTHPSDNDSRAAEQAAQRLQKDIQEASREPNLSVIERVQQWVSGLLP